jgi:hypothetical protein
VPLKKRVGSWSKFLIIGMVPYQIQIQILASKNPWKGAKNRLIYYTFWLDICKLMRIQIRLQIQLITLMRIRIRIFIRCGSESGCGSRLPKWCGSMQIRIQMQMQINNCFQGSKLLSDNLTQLKIEIWNTISKLRPHPIFCFLLSSLNCAKTSSSRTIGAIEGRCSQREKKQDSVM